LHYEELYLTMEQERPRQEETIKKLTGKCSYKIKLYNNTPSHTIVNAVSYISYRPMFLQFFLWMQKPVISNTPASFVSIVLMHVHEECYE